MPERPAPVNVQAKSDRSAPGVIGSMCDATPRAVETRKRLKAPSSRRCCLRLDGSDPVRTPGKEKQASSVPTFGGPARPKKPVRRCFKLRPPWSAGLAGFPSGCRLLSGSVFPPGSPPWGSHPSGIEPKTLAAVRPLVRMPTNRHAATGTCELGRAHIRMMAPRYKRFFGVRGQNCAVTGDVYDVAGSYTEGQRCARISTSTTLFSRRRWR